MLHGQLLAGDSKSACGRDRDGLRCPERVMNRFSALSVLWDVA